MLRDVHYPSFKSSTESRPSRNLTAPLTFKRLDLSPSSSIRGERSRAIPPRLRKLLIRPSTADQLITKKRSIFLQKTSERLVSKSNERESPPGRSRAVSGILFRVLVGPCDHSSGLTVADELKRRYPKARRGSRRSTLP